MAQDLFNIAPAFYGMSMVPQASWVDYGFALLIIAGSDGEVSDPEMEWLTIELAEALGVDEKIVAAWEEYDFDEEPLAEVFAKIDSRSVASYSKLLLYDAIRMSYADDEYAKSEREKVGEAAIMLNVDKDTVLGIEALVEQERALEKLRAIIL
ncbi:MAG: hypothetical protein AAGA85_03010 [Bacteroidota bacterium]